MKVLSKKKVEYDILKLYSVIDSEKTNQFDIKACIKTCETFFNKLLKKEPDFYELNYGLKTWKSSSAYNIGLQKVDAQKIGYLSIFDLTTESTLTISYNHANIDSDFSFVEVLIAVNIPFLDLIKQSDFIENMHFKFGFNYGYGLNLDNTFDFVTERKIKKSFFGFSSSSSISKKDIDWRKSINKIKDGYVKKIYPFNLLNQNQFQSSQINHFICKGIGEVTTINKNLIIWNLNENELLSLKEQMILR